MALKRLKLEKVQDCEGFALCRCTEPRAGETRLPYHGLARDQDPACYGPSEYSGHARGSHWNVYGPDIHGYGVRGAWCGCSG